ncbi:proline-specific permease [Glarea lozoyensis ATCC 20868]|uniref:Proline-specific permease n=1 Tax=Glarea lozoyensis (strain ATCC 20868 / MF5171) TaxID=1116229 RepID=S3D8T2_GLAL2|nr:proline-specific permease [Glarea lozoyensis ATCC 20868]EPE34140.1 proline-specific permease [Glarea lozoyensis ATCC 20868]
MDHEKPQAVYPQVYEYEATPTQTTASPEPMMRPPSIDELEYVEDRRERRGDSLWRVLKERHVSMIAFSGTIGNGLFLGSGRSLASAGPGGAVLSYILVGTVISSVISCLGEMTALMPVNAPVMEFPRRYLDRGVGFAVGWVYWFAYAILAADEIVAVANTVAFKYDDGRTYINWVVGGEVDAAVWIALFLVIVVAINMLPVKYFGEFEYVFGCFKLMFIVMLIVLMVCLDTMQPRKGAYYDQVVGPKNWKAPYTFFNKRYRVRNNDGTQRFIEGQIGSFLGIWTTFVNIMFAYIGMDIVAATAAESTSLADAESMKMAARKTNIRIVTLYSLAVLTASFMVPMDHPFINGGGQSVGSHSVFLIAVVEAGLPMAAHFFNAVFVFSSFTCAINSLYVASRVLHTLALREQTGPDFITLRLQHTRSGVPVRAVLVTAGMMLIGFMGRTGSPGERLGELASNCTVSCLIVYTVICATYLSFFKTLGDAKLYGNASEAQTAMYDRDNPRYPYKSHGQWLKACYGLVSCLLLVTFNGVGAFLEKPFDVRRFIASYISVPVFILLLVGYKIGKHGFRFSQWGPERSNDLRNCIQATSEVRKGRLEFPDEGFTKENGRTFVDWIWRHGPPVR